MSEAATRKKPMDSPIAFASPPHFDQRCCGAMIAVRKNSGRARAHDFLYTPAYGCFQKINGSLHVVSKNLTRIARPEPIVARNVKDISAIFHRRINRTPTEEIALHPIDRIIAARFCRSRERPNISAGLNQQRRHMAADKTGCARDKDVVSAEEMMEIVRDHA